MRWCFLFPDLYSFVEAWMSCKLPVLLLYHVLSQRRKYSIQHPVLLETRLDVDLHAIDEILSNSRIRGLRCLSQSFHSQVSVAENTAKQVYNVILFISGSRPIEHKCTSTQSQTFSYIRNLVNDSNLLLSRMKFQIAIYTKWSEITIRYWDLFCIEIEILPCSLVVCWDPLFLSVYLELHKQEHVIV